MVSFLLLLFVFFFNCSSFKHMLYGHVTLSILFKDYMRLYLVIVKYYEKKKNGKGK